MTFYVDRPKQILKSADFLVNYYNVASLSKRILTAKGIFLQRLKSIGHFLHAKLNDENQFLQMNGRTLIIEKLCF